MTCRTGLALGAWAAVLGCTSDPPPLDPPIPNSPPPVLQPRFDGPVPTNLLMISVDTMRRDHLGVHGDLGLTPFLDQLASESWVADDAMACSNWTVASTACVLSGATNLDRAADRGMIPTAAGGVLAPIPRPEPTLPWWLGEAGFSTMLVTTNGFFSGAYGNAQGYQVLRYDGPAKVAGTWDRTKEIIEPSRGGRAMPAPWMLHLHFFEPHRPYTPPDTYLTSLASLPEIPFDLTTTDGQKQAVQTLSRGTLDPEVAEAVRDHMRARYAAEIRYFDDQFRDMWADLDALGYLDDALIVFWTDHGEELWEHGLTEHGKLLHAQENAAVLWMWARNLIPDRYRGPVHHIDLAPTLLSLYDLPIPETVTGTPIGLEAPDRVRFAMSNAYTGPVLAVRRGEHKLHFRWSGQPTRVFDVVADPVEREDLFDPDDPTTLALWDLLKPRIEQAIPYVADDPRRHELVWPADLP